MKIELESYKILLHDRIIILLRQYEKNKKNSRKKYSERKTVYYTE